jgi:hypothetical protein
MQVLAPNVRNIIQRVSGQHLSFLRKKDWAYGRQGEKKKGRNFGTACNKYVLLI